MLRKYQLLFNTVKYLKFGQVYYRLWYLFKKPKTQTRILVSYASWNWQREGAYSQSLWEGNQVCFLSHKRAISNAVDWNCDKQEKLWLYNLHYFDDLNASHAEQRELLHYAFIDKWILENPPCTGVGWEPYPLSLRIVNWVKWFSKKNDVDTKYLSSIAEQADALSQQLEYHILGNHLFSNAKALAFVGAFLGGEVGDKFLRLGLKILEQEVAEQFLEDGAHFELTPMYHEILLWDLLELIDLAKTSNKAELVACLPYWSEIAERALSWLSVMIHEDGEVSFFNDSAIGIAMRPQQVFDYAQKLELKYNKVKELLATNKASGYSRVSFDSYSVIFDHANVGPDYLPGHAHADTLSFELSIGEQRVFVNSGTSLYGTSAERLRQRKTAAHNTLSVSGLDSSQVWSGFRVAKRAYAQLEMALSEDQRVCLVASHNGYMQQKPKVKHTRELVCTPNGVIINDLLSKPVSAHFHLHLHPDLDVINLSDKELKIMKGDEVLCLISSAEAVDIKESTWHPEFGKSIANKKIEIEFTSGHLKTKIKYIKRNL